MSVHAFDQRETLLGQGTVALELAAQARRWAGMAEPWTPCWCRSAAAG